MPARAISPPPKTYAQLREAVIAVVVRGRREIDWAWLETYHETGRLINEHVLQTRDRADYGVRVYAKLAEDTGISERTLRQCAQFQRCYPIRHARAELSWAHYQLLIQVADDARRKTIETEAIRQHWTTRELETRVRAFNAVALASERDPASADSTELLTPRRGTPGLHPVVDLPSTSLGSGGDGLAVDLGFKFYRALGSAAKVRASPSTALRAGDIVRLDATGVSKVTGATAADLFTYAATVRKVVDGDTLEIALAIAPGFTHRLKLRLRGLDCPEMSTAAGRAAKAFVEAFIRPGDTVIVSTTKPDKYDRYLADVFVAAKLRAESPELRDRSGAPQFSAAIGNKPKAESLSPTAEDDVFLNNALLESGHATRYDGGVKEE